MSIENLPPPDQGERLTVGGLLRSALASFTDRPAGDIISIVGVWTIVLIVGQVLLLLGEAGNAPATPDTVELTRPASAVIAELIFSIVNVIAFVDIAVKWSRYLILDEAPGGFLEQRLNARRWNYFLRWLLVIVCMLAVTALLTVPFSLVAGALGGGSAILFVLALWFVFLYLSAGRLGLYLIGAALGDQRMSLATSWRTTAEAGLTITLAVLAATLLFVAPYVVLLSVYPAVAGASVTIAIILFTPILVALSIAMYLAYEAIIAFAYTRLVPEPAPGTLIL